MRYPGSKRRFRKQLIEIVTQMRGERQVLIEPFLGGGESFETLAPLFDVAYGGEAGEDLALMWQAVADGWVPPSTVTEDEYRAARTEPPSPLRGFIGTGCSFGGKWFGGYARGGFNGDVPRDHQAESSRAVARAAPAFSGRLIKHCDYEEWNDCISQDVVVYADPPYAGTLKYRSDFDHDRFWSVMGRWAETGALVLVSEQVAPDGWIPAVTFDRRSSTALAAERKIDAESIWAWGETA